jgi:hypothetical protein
MGARDLGFAVGLTSSLGQQAKNAVVGLAGLPIAVIKGLIKLVEDPQGTVEATLAKIKALPAYVKHAPAAFKEHINAIQAIEDPYEQGKAVGELMGQELPVGKIASKLGRWGKVSKPKKRQERIGSKGGAEKVKWVLKEGVAGAKVERIDKIIEGSSRNVQEAYSSAKAWLGEDCRMITKDAGDIILISKDGLRKLRFDIKNPHGDVPHIHIEMLKNGKWKNALSDVHRLYPKK